MHFLNLNFKQWQKSEQSVVALRWLSVTEDVSFRLSSVAEKNGISLLCESFFSNLTIRSSFWDGQADLVQDCSLKDSLLKNDFLRFPINQTSSSYIELPDNIIIPDQIHKATGFLASDSLFGTIFSGSNK